MRCCGLSMEEVHQVAYLTMKGWTLVGEEWTKEGFTHSHEVSRGCGCCRESKSTPYFPLDEAYYAQTEKDDAGA